MTSTMLAARPLTAAFPFAFASADGVTLREERASDVPAREALLDAAFGPARRRKTCERLRQGRACAPGLALVASDGEALVGTIRLWNVDAGGAPALLLGPLAVAETHRSLGLGGRLIRAALARAASRGHKAAILVGDAPYYERFGFRRDLAVNLAMPGPVEPERFLGLELESGALGQASGLVVAAGSKTAPVIALSRGAAKRAA